MAAMEDDCNKKRSSLSSGSAGYASQTSTFSEKHIFGEAGIRKRQGGNTQAMACVVDSKARITDKVQVRPHGLLTTPQGSVRE